MGDATIEKVKKVYPHPNADTLDIVEILGFKCITKSGLYEVGQYVVYVRTDSCLPDRDWALDFKKYSPKRIKAVKLRGLYSEGILLSSELLSDDLDQSYFSEEFIGKDVSDIIGVEHWYSSVANSGSGHVGLPYNIPKTNENRWENFRDRDLPIEEEVDITLKVDGQSATYFYVVETDEFGVTSRNVHFDKEAENYYTSHVEKYDIYNKLKEYCISHNVSLAIRGESFGNSIQSNGNNEHSKLPLRFAIFSVYNISKGVYERKGSEHYFKNVAEALNIPHVPIIEENVTLTQDKIDHYSLAKKLYVDEFNRSILFEGVVVNYENGSFKVINKTYDSKK